MAQFDFREAHDGGEGWIGREVVGDGKFGGQGVGRQGGGARDEEPSHSAVIHEACQEAVKRREFSGGVGYLSEGAGLRIQKRFSQAVAVDEEKKRAFPVAVKHLDERRKALDAVALSRFGEREACFKAVARTLRQAIRREGSELPSTKGAL